MTQKTEDTKSAQIADDVEQTDADLWKEIDEDEAASSGEEGDDAPGKDAGGDGDDLDVDEADDAPTSATSKDGSGTKSQDTKTPADKTDWEAKAKDAEHRWRSEQGRSKAEQQRAERLQKQLEDLKKQTTTKATNDTTDEGRASRLEKIRSEYGDVLDPVIEEVTNLRARLDTLSASEQDRLTSLQADYDVILERESSVFTEEHPDGFEVLKANGAQFRQWIDDQPREMRDIFKANHKNIVDGTGAALLVSKFKAQMQTNGNGNTAAAKTETRSNRRQMQMDGASTTRSVQRQAITPDVSPDTEDEGVLWDYWERQDKKAVR